MTQADSFRRGVVSVQTDERFTEAVVRLSDGSQLCFCHRVDERWAKALGAAGDESNSGLAGTLLGWMAIFRLNAKHLDVHFQDHSRWEERFRVEG